MDRRLFGWGLFFILVGAIPLAVHANLLDQDLVGRWPSLWPFLLIGGGVGLLLRRTPLEWLGGATVALTLGLMGGGALATGFAGVPAITGCGGPGNGTPFLTQSGTIADGARLNVEFSCGSLTVVTGSAPGWTLSGTAPGAVGPIVETPVGATRIRTPSSNDFIGAGGHNVWNLAVPSTRFAYGLTMNAGEADVDLRTADLASFSVTLNAGTVGVDLGGNSRTYDVNVNVNAGTASVSLPSTDRALNLSINAGKLTVCMRPNDAGKVPVRVRWSGALGSNNFDAIGMVKVDEQTWVSRDYDVNSTPTELHVSANAGTFDLTLQGCGA